MSEASVAARKAMKEKAHRMATGDPHQKVDASSWTEAEPMDNDVQTGPRPISKRQFKRGGMVHGEHAKHHAGHKPRKAGGRALVDDFVNRDVKEANEHRAGTKHVGGMKRGGRAHKADGGSFVPTSRMAFNSGPSILSKAGGIPSLKRGGEAKHSDEKEDKALIRKMVKKEDLKRKAGGSVSDGELEGMRPKGGREAHKNGGEADHWIAGATKNKGALHRKLHVPDGEKIPAKKLAKAEHSKNPTERKEANLAKTLKGLHRERHAKGGRAGKGKMNVNIIIAQPDHQQSQGAMPPPQQPLPIPPRAPMPAMPPGGLSPQGMPPGMPMGVGQPPPMMPRKRGGRAHADMEYGAGGGLGRLEKIRDYGHEAKADSKHY